METRNHPDKIALFNDPRQLYPVVIKQKLDYLFGCSLYQKRNHHTDLSWEAYSKAQTIFRLLEPKDVIGHSKQRFGAANDGGYILIPPSDDGKSDKHKIAYSFGISHYDPFSIDMANLGYHVFQYDGTVDKSPTEHPLIKFYKFNISGSNNPLSTERNFRQILDDNSHHGKDIILQIDIEGAEWDFFDSLSELEMQQFKQFNVELHHFDYEKINFIDRYIKILEKINLTHQCIHLQANNCAASSIFEGLCLFPESFEVTYLRKINPVTQEPEYKFEECLDEFPIEGLDAPCCPDYPDIYIGRFNYNLQKETTEIKTEFMENIFLGYIVKLYGEIHKEIGEQYKEIKWLHEEIAEKTSLRYFLKKLKAFFRNRILGL